MQTAATSKACYVCYKPTITVLATINTTDFLYTCPVHLEDPNFATLLGDSGDGVSAGASKKLGLSAEEIEKVKEEWMERQRKKEKGGGKEKEKEKETEKEKEKKEGADRATSMDQYKPANVAAPAPTSRPATHKRYALHRDFFAMRLTEHRKRRQVAQAKELAPRFPGAPRGALASRVS